MFEGKKDTRLADLQHDRDAMQLEGKPTTGFAASTANLMANFMHEYARFCERQAALKTLLETRPPTDNDVKRAVKASTRSYADLFEVFKDCKTLLTDLSKAGSPTPTKEESEA